MISVITPVHKASVPYLKETYESLLNQTVKDWEWILLENAGGKVPEEIQADEQVQVFHTEDDAGEHNKVGRLKSMAAGLVSGDILLELDADDLLLPWAMERVHEAFSSPGIAMAYSNDAEFRDGTWESNAYSEYWGWQWRPFFWEGHELKEMIAWPPGPWMMRQIFWSPNHLRAWRTSAYRRVGGHNPTLALADDHELNIRFYLAYGAEGIKHIDECCYLYRVHDHNSCRVFNAEIQQGTLALYLKYSRRIAIRWAKDEGLRLLDLGGRFNNWPEFETVDLLDADITTDLEHHWPFEDDSVGVIRASHIVEHLHDPIHTMNEAYRVLAPGGWLFIDVPSTDGRGAFQDPTHVSFWNENSFWYYTRKSHARFIHPAYKGRFQASRIVTYYPTQFEKDNDIPIVQADLIALKPPYSSRPVGEVLI